MSRGRLRSILGAAGMSIRSGRTPASSFASSGRSSENAPLQPSDRWSRIAVVALVNSFVGATVAATAVNAGLAPPMAAVLTVLMFAGAGQFAALAVLLASGPASAAWLAAMLVNARFVLLGAGIAQHVRMPTATRLLAAWFVVDPGVLIVRAEPAGSRATRTYWQAGLTIFCGWAFGALLGTAGIGRLEDPERFGLDVALPGLLLAILGTSLRDRDNLLAAACGAGIAVTLLLAVPPPIAVLLSCLGVAVPLALRNRGREGKTR